MIYRRSTRTRSLVTPAFAAVVVAVFAVLLGGALPAAGQSLRGSPASLDRQNRVAQEHDYTFLSTGGQVRTFAEKGWLVRLRTGNDYELHAVSYPYTRPEVALFVQRLAGQYRAACGEPLVVTSLTRPRSGQPRNASDRSVHPTGMALDLRYSRSRRCRQWLEDVLLSLEKSGVVEATRERYPPHYHVAVFPRQYSAYVDQIQRKQVTQVAQVSRVTPVARAAVAQAERAAYKVRNGDSLWTIARAHGTTVDEIRSLNGLRGNKIFAGQVIEVPRAR